MGSRRVALLVGLGGGLGFQHNRTPLYFLSEFIKGHYLSFLGVPSLDRRGLFQDNTDEMV